jgi:hypothetical protein
MLVEVFDRGWAEVSQQVDPTAVEHARVSLAHCVLVHYSIPDLTLASVEAFEKQPAPRETGSVASVPGVIAHSHPLGSRMKIIPVSVHHPEYGTMQRT